MKITKSSFIPQMERLTNFQRIRGIWKYIVEDFKVQEISLRYGTLEFSEKYSFNPESKGDHLVCVFIKKNIETFQMIKDIAKKLNVSPSRISIAGVKDKKAWTIQLGSIYKIKKEKIEHIKSDKYKIIPLEYSEKKVYLGELKGNRFEITIRGISKENIDILKQNIEEYKKEYEFYFPNYYGIQRFGTHNNSSAKLGYLLLKKSYKEFLKEYLGVDKEFNDLTEEDINILFNKLKNKYHEKNVLKYLIHHDMKDFIGAIKTIPKGLLKLFVNAYQSFLFNEIVSQTIKTQKNRWEELKDILLPIPGSDCFSFALKTEYESKIEQTLKEQGISHNNFKFPEFGIESKGTVRNILSKAENLQYHIVKDEIFEDTYKIILKFDLKKGSYASSFLNELFDLSY